MALLPSFFWLFLLFAVASPIQGQASDAEPSSEWRGKVGVPTRISELVLPGTELDVAPIDFRGSLVLRILAARKHGSAYRYDLEFYGLDPGIHNLCAYLTRKDGSTTDDLPKVPILIESRLPPGQVTPNELEYRAHSNVGGYWKWAILAGLVWLGGLYAILSGFRRKRDDAPEDAGPQGTTLAHRLKPLVEQAIEGTLPKTKLAELEMSLVTLWRRRLSLEGTPMQEVVPRLKAHEEAGPLLRQLEEWLHHPTSEQSLDISQLLSPYRSIAVEEFDEATEVSAATVGR